MGFGEIYFYVLTGLVLSCGFFIWLMVEDVKLWKFFRNMVVVSSLILLLGLFLVKFSLTFLSAYKTIYIYSLPMILLLMNRILFLVHNKLFGEPFIRARTGYLEGFWYTETVDEKKITIVNKIYYFYYSFLHILKMGLIISFFIK